MNGAHARVSSAQLGCYNLETITADNDVTQPTQELTEWRIVLTGAC